MYPILFHIGTGPHAYAVHTFGILLTLAILAGVSRTYFVAKAREGQPDGLKADDVLDAGIWMVIAGIIGARVLFVLLDLKTYLAHPTDMLKVWEGGISFHGALFGGLLALVLFCQKRQISILRVADLYAPSLMLSYAIGRVGCFFNGCCYGRPTNLPWHVRFMDEGVLTPYVHPTQLYATGLSLIFFGFLVWLEKRQGFAGQLLCWYGILASIERFIIEIWRAGATSDVYALGLTDTQWLCITMFIVSTMSLNYLRRRTLGTGTQERLVGVAER